MKNPDSYGKRQPLTCPRLNPVCVSIPFLGLLVSILLSLCPGHARPYANEEPLASATPTYKYSTCWVCGLKATAEDPVPHTRCIRRSPGMILLLTPDESRSGIDNPYARGFSPRLHRRAGLSFYRKQRTADGAASLRALELDEVLPWIVRGVL